MGTRLAMFVIMLVSALGVGCSAQRPNESDPPAPTCDTPLAAGVTLHECGPPDQWTRREGLLVVAGSPALAFCHAGDDPVGACSEITGFSEERCRRLRRMAAPVYVDAPPLRIRRVPVACQPGRTVEMMFGTIQGPSLRAQEVWEASYDSGTAQLIQFRVRDDGESVVNRTCCVHPEGRNGTLGVLYGEYFDADYYDPDHIEYTSEDLENGTAP